MLKNYSHQIYEIINIIHFLKEFYPKIQRNKQYPHNLLWGLNASS